MEITLDNGAPAVIVTHGMGLASMEGATLMNQLFGREAVAPLASLDAQVALKRRCVFALVVFIVSYSLFVFCSAPSVTAGDSGEFMTAAITLSIPHAPSFPLYTVLCRTFIDVFPVGGLPIRCNYFSALCGALSLSILFLAMTRGLSSIQGYSMLGSILMVMLLATGSPSFLTNSVVTEVFSLNTLFIVSLIAFWWRPILFWFILGVGLGNHHILVLMAPLGLVMHVKQVRNVPIFAVAFMLGFSIYLFLPLRSAQEPPLNWGQPTTTHRFVRTLMRKDYGSLKLSLEAQPSRSLSNTVKQCGIFLKLVGREIPWWLAVFGFCGLLWGVYRRERFWLGLLICFMLSGPGFFLLSNLPMNTQTEGIMGRFMIMPVMLIVMGLCPFVQVIPKFISVLLILGVVSAGASTVPVVSAYRQNYLVWDYGHSLLRHIPLKGALFLDGGDDAFYSLALLVHGLGQRSDLIIHDRGGLVFKNPYGNDFRMLSREEKQARRVQVEGQVLHSRPLFYSTMDSRTFPGHTLIQQGFLYAAVTESMANRASMSWPLIAVRSLYPLQVEDVRHRALAAFFPYMKGRQALNDGKISLGLPILRRATVFGRDVEWFISNVSVDYAQTAYKALVDGRWSEAEAVYRQWLELEPSSEQAMSNLGVVLERSGRLLEAEAHYKRVMAELPLAADPAYNLGVLAWRRQEWAIAKDYFEQALLRRPNHEAARQALLRLEVIQKKKP